MILQLRRKKSNVSLQFDSSLCIYTVLIMNESLEELLIEFFAEKKRIKKNIFVCQIMMDVVNC